MITLTVLVILAVLLVIAIVITVIALLIGGVGFIFAFGDIILCVVILYFVIRWILRRIVH